MAKQSRQTWIQLKLRLKEFEREELLDLLHDLYDLSGANTAFLHARILATTPEEMAEPYRRTISAVFNPPSGVPSLDLRAARRALSVFERVGAGPEAQIDLMLYYVEAGVVCTRTYGDIDAAFYSSLRSVYRRAVAALLALDDPRVTKSMRPRFAAVVRDVVDVGWGLYEDLLDVYGSSLVGPDDAEW